MSSLIFVFMMLCAVSMAYVHSPACGANEKYSVCEKNCEPICPATEKKICFTMCMPRCVCIEGYSRTERNGVCVPKDDCSNFQFPEFQDYLNSEENNDDSIIPEPSKDNSAPSMSGNDDLPSLETVDDDSTTSESVSDDFTTTESVNNDFTTVTSVNDDVSTTSESVSDDFSTTESANNDFTTLTSANDDGALPENE